MTSRNRPQKLLLALSISLALSGCGGGGSSGPAVTPMPSPSLADDISKAGEVLSGQVDTPEKKEGINNISNKMRSSIVKNGSVIQSTNIDGTSSTTQDTINLEITGDPANPAYKLTYNAGGSASNVDIINFAQGARNEANTDTKVDFYNVEGGTALIVGSEAGYPVDIDGDNNNDGQLGLIIFSTYNEDKDTDYLAGGLWIYLPGTIATTSDNIDENFILGGFIDSPGEFDDNAAVAGLTGRATFNGSGTGIITAHRSDTLIFDSVIADIYLTAEFGNGAQNGMIGGYMDDFHVNGGDEEIAGRIDLDSASIGSDGFFQSSLSGWLDQESYMIEGNWGGQLYGDDTVPDPKVEYIAGTVGGGGSIRYREADHNVNLVMIYSAPAARQ